ncbi:MAG: cbb3-type cytochrome c oxidase N-terminal domain-containing protein [Flavobacteriales bacterium]
MKRVFLFALVLLSERAFSQAPAVAEKVSEPVSVYQSPVFYALVTVAVILLVFILQLARVLSSVARNYAEKQKPNFENVFKIMILGIGSLALPSAARAEAGSTSLDFLQNGFGNTTINFLVVIIVIELFVAVYYISLIRYFVKKESAALQTEEAPMRTSYFWDRFNQSVSIEQEAAVLTDHDYDGIRELDNALPPWWKYGFYLTIVFAIAYLGYYHMSANAPLSAQEYDTEMEEAKIAIAEYKKKAADLVDETSVVMLSDAAALGEGSAIFKQHCVVCHGQGGEGLVGPNLTDPNWIHGGNIKDLFKTIKYGVSGKGMKSWQQELSPQMMAKVASYIKTLAGTNPPNPKAPEGEVYVEAVSAPSATDTLATPARDTLTKSVPQ